MSENKIKYPIVVETFKSMYEKKLINEAKVKSMLNKKSISMDEYNYIVGKKG